MYAWLTPLATEMVMPMRLALKLYSSHLRKGQWIVRLVHGSRRMHWLRCVGLVPQRLAALVDPQVVPAREARDLAHVFVVGGPRLLVVAEDDQAVRRGRQQEEPERHVRQVEAVDGLVDGHEGVGGVGCPGQICNVQLQPGGVHALAPLRGGAHRDGCEQEVEEHASNVPPPDEGGLRAAPTPPGLLVKPVGHLRDRWPVGRFKRIAF